MMVAALAAGQLRTYIQFDCAPRLAVEGRVVTAETMAISTIMKGAPAAASLPTLLPPLPTLLPHDVPAAGRLHVAILTHAAGILTA